MKRKKTEQAKNRQEIDKSNLLIVSFFSFFAFNLHIDICLNPKHSAKTQQAIYRERERERKNRQKPFACKSI